MNNLLSYCGLVDAKIRASDINLPVTASGGCVVPLPDSNHQNYKILLFNIRKRIVVHSDLSFFEVKIFIQEFYNVDNSISTSK